MAEMVSIGAKVAGEALKGGVEPKGLSNLGEVGAQDMGKFQGLMGGGASPMGQAQAPQGIESGGPFSMQSTRVTETPKHTSMGEKLASEAKDIMSIGRGQEDALKQKLKEMGSGEWDASKAMEFQYMAGEMQLMTEIVSKGVNKTVQAVQSTVKNQ